MSRDTRNEKEFCFRLSREKLEAFQKSTPEQRLEWLEEVNEFVNTFVPKEKREAWKKISGYKR